MWEDLILNEGGKVRQALDLNFRIRIRIWFGFWSVASSRFWIGDEIDLNCIKALPILTLSYLVCMCVCVCLSLALVDSGGGRDGACDGTALPLLHGALQVGSKIRNLNLYLCMFKHLNQ